MGKAFVYGDDINTDVIFPGKYTYTVTERGGDGQVRAGGSRPVVPRARQAGRRDRRGQELRLRLSREQAVTCLTELGVAAVIATSFARIYFRNAINAGLAGDRAGGCSGQNQGRRRG